MKILWNGKFSHNYLITKQTIGEEEIMKFNSLHLKVNESIASSNKLIDVPINLPYATRQKIISTSF